MYRVFFLLVGSRIVLDILCTRAWVRSRSLDRDWTRCTFVSSLCQLVCLMLKRIPFAAGCDETSFRPSELGCRAFLVVGYVFMVGRQSWNKANYKKSKENKKMPSIFACSQHPSRHPPPPHQDTTCTE